MEAQLHREEEEHKTSTMKKVKAKVHKLKETIKHGHGHHDEEHHDEKIMNESPAVRSGLMEPTDMGRAVLVEDLYATHSDILDTPARSFAQWEEEEKHGAPPPLPTGIYGAVPAKVGHHRFNQNANREQLMGSIGKSTAKEEHPTAPTPATAVSPAEVHAPTTKTDVAVVGEHGFNQDMKREQTRGGIGKSTATEKDSPSDPNPTTQFSPKNRQAQVPATTYTALSEVGYEGFDQDLNREKLMSGTGKSSSMVQDPSAPNPKSAVSPANHQTKVTDPTNTGGKEAGITDVLRSFNKMGVYDEPHSKSSHQNEPKLHTGSHDQPRSSEPDQTKTTGSHDQFVSHQNEPHVYTGSYGRYKSSESDQTEPTGSHDRIVSYQNKPKVYTGSYGHYKSTGLDQTKPTGSHDQVVADQNKPKLYTGSYDHYKSSESNQTEPEVHTGSHDQFAPEPAEDVPLSTIAGDPSSRSSSYTEKTTYTNSDKAGVEEDMMVSELGEDESETKSPTNYAQKVAETVTGTLGPVYETVVGVGSSVVSKMQGSERPAMTRITEKKEGSVKDYVVEALRPGDEDKVVSDVITHVFHRNDPPVQEVTATSIYVRDEEGAEERRLQESGN